MTVRPLLRTAVVGFTLGAAALTATPAAVAAPGDNGDVKIHSVGTPFNDQRNEPKVCQFYLAAFNFDTLQNVSWSIVPQPPKETGPARNGQITLATGTGQTLPLSLPDGMYKLTWKFQGQSGAGKMKVFKVDCPGGVGQPNGPVGAGGGGAATLAADSSSLSGVGVTMAAGLAGAAGLILVRRSRRRADGAS
ncbi:hypothetical protein [Streptomyces sp. A5-4]|uniref:hypothetical protein n=1 Tax=Streptomyces sp. A5-4 TaxID=3384771 RepID=UPI003DA9461E